MSHSKFSCAGNGVLCLVRRYANIKWLANVSLLLLPILFGSCYYKLCGDSCLMNGTEPEGKFDSPCEDNVSFTVAKNRFGRPAPEVESIITVDAEMPIVLSAAATDLATLTSGDTEEESETDRVIETAPEYTTDMFLEEYADDNERPDFTDLPSSLAMHAPIYPAVQDTRSEPILFTLTPAPGTQVQEAMLRIKVSHATQADLINENSDYSYPDVAISPDFTVTWRARLDGKYDVVGADPSPVSRIAFTQSLEVPDNRATFVKYQFIAKYIDGETETSEVSFALQNFHQELPELPAPVYAQGTYDLVDILFIPAKDHGQGGNLTPQTLIDFRKTCGDLIQNVFFKEPVINFYRKEFNFWINKMEGTAMDYGKCRGCPHLGPENLITIPAEIEVKALLHKADQWDFTDGADLFSVTMSPSKYHFFLHEAGHAAFDLADEYEAGWHHEERIENFPNNWKRRRSAENDAVLRHKQPDDARRIR